MRIIPFWVLCVTVGSLLPGRAKVAIGTTTPMRLEATHEVGGIAHQAIHFAVFGATAILFLLVSRSAWHDFIAVLSALGLGAALEMVQHILFGSVLEWWDIRDDGFGVVVAFVLLHGLRLAKTSVIHSPEPLMASATIGAVNTAPGRPPAFDSVDGSRSRS
jgi:hypothetical protein